MEGPARKTPNTEAILQKFQDLRAEQRGLSSKISEFELELNEHKLVIETLKNVDEGRKCFRLIGGVLTERKVKDVLPQLIESSEKLQELIKKFNEELTKKGQEINEYKETYNIRIRTMEDLKQEQQQLQKQKEAQSESKSRGNVLVS